MLVTVTGPDRTGVTATLTGILAEQGAILHDIEQVVVQGQLTLCLLVGLPHTRDVLKELLFAAKELRMELDFQPVEGDPPVPARPAEAGRRYVITAIGPSLGARHLHAIASTLAAEGANIEKISRLSEATLASVEMHVLAAAGARQRRAQADAARRSPPAPASTCRCSARACTAARSAWSSWTWTRR